MVCTFFGHRDCYGLEADVLRRAIEAQIEAGVDTFYVGHQGHFDAMVLDCLKALRETYPHIRVWVVLAYRPTERTDYDEDSLYPEEVALGPPRFAIDRRNRWMLENADRCLCFVEHPWGGEYKYMGQAEKKGLTVIRLGKNDG